MYQPTNDVGNQPVWRSQSFHPSVIYVTFIFLRICISTKKQQRRDGNNSPALSVVDWNAKSKCPLHRRFHFLFLEILAIIRGIQQMRWGNLLFLSKVLSNGHNIQITLPTIVITGVGFWNGYKKLHRASNKPEQT